MQINTFCCCCSVAKSCLILCNLMGCSLPGFPVLHYLPEFAQTHVHWVDDTIQLSHLLSPCSLPALNLPQHQGLCKWVGSSHQVAQVLELQHQSFQWIFRIDFLYDWLFWKPGYMYTYSWFMLSYIRKKKKLTQKCKAIILK